MFEPLIFLGSVFLISFTGAMMPGPVTAVVIGNSERSPYAGLIVALGHGVIELPLIVFLAFYAGNFMENLWVRTLVSVGGGIMLIYLAWQMIRSAGREENVEASNTAAFKGGIMTTINPYFFIWWATVGLTLIMRSLEFGKGIFIAMIAVHYSVDFIWDGILGWITYRSGVFGKPKAKKVLYIILGICLLAVAAYFLLDGIQTLVS